jgi:hypothetical protein
MTRKALVLGVAILAMHGEARAQQWLTGNDLLGYCTDASTRAYCMYYVEGVWDAISNAQGIGTLPSRGKGCISFPTVGVNSGQVVDVVTRWLQAHPEVRHLAAGGLVWGALTEAWPCPAR